MTETPEYGYQFHCQEHQKLKNRRYGHLLRKSPSIGDRDDGFISSKQDNTRELVAEMYSTLPRELRNRVYTFCVEGAYDSEIIVRRAASSGKAFTLLTRAFSGLHSIQWVEETIPSYMNARYIGPDIAKEMVESYFWARTFKFSHLDVDLIGEFLGTDVLSLGMVPADFIRQLQLQIQPLAYALHSAQLREADEERCRRAIESLALIRTTRADIMIHIDLAHNSTYTSNEQFVAAFSFLHVIMQDINRLRDRGIRIEVAFSENWHEAQAKRFREGSISAIEEYLVEMEETSRSLNRESVN